MNEENLTVTNMTCHHCEKTIKDTLNNLNGIKKVTINLDKKTVTILYNEEDISLEEIKSAIKDSDYIVE